MSSEDLLTFLAKDIEQRSSLLVDTIKSDYLAYKGKDLTISKDSLIIEIWGHIYAGYLARRIKKLLRFKLTNQVADFVLKRSDCIDCGERGIDSNRFLWDFLSNFKSMLLFFIPKR